MLRQVLRRLWWEVRMGGRLVKYEFVSFCRFMPVFYLALLAVSLVAGLSHQRLDGLSGGEPALVAGLWSMSLMVIFTVTLVVVFQRFRDNLLREPSYFMLTLPVSAWTLVAAKLLAALSLFLASALAGVASGLVYLLSSGFNTGVSARILGNIDTAYDLYLLQGGSAGQVILLALSLLVVLSQGLNLLYALLAAAQKLPRLRLLAVAAGYFLVPLLIQAPVMRLLPGNEPPLDASAASALQAMLAVQPAVVVLNALFGALYFWAAGFLLKRVNIE